MAGGRHGRLVGLVGVLRGRLTACMACPYYAIGRQQKYASDVCGATEAKAGGRQGRLVGLVGVLRGRLTSKFESEDGDYPSFWTQGSLRGPVRAEDIVRWGVWLGRHIY